MIDVLVMGAGPAGLAVAAEAAKGGAEVSVVAPRPHQRWAPNYGVWLDDIEDASLATCVGQAWRKARVWLDGAGPLTLERTYGRFDNDALQNALTESLHRAGGTCLAGTAQHVSHATDHSEVTLSDGRRLHTRALVDATGARSHFVRRSPRRCAFQSAYGELVRVEAHPFAPGEMALMDYRHAGEPATFLYAMPFTEDLIFVEETSLAAYRPMSHLALRSRLYDRLERMGIEVRGIERRETCLIPMGLGIPPVQRVVAFGAAAGFIHPATGYQLARALRLAKPTAHALLEGLASEGPDTASQRAYDTMWPRHARRAWELFAFGMDVMCSFDASELQSFLRAFFSMPSSAWAGYMSGTSTPREIALSMGSVFMRADGLRGALMSAAMRGEGRPLWSALVAGGAR